jgi:hypothetical protein
LDIKGTPHERYSASIESRSIAQSVPYDELLRRIMEFTIRGALARSIDESEWEHEEIRRKGLRSLQVFHNNKAVWICGETFKQERAEAERELDARFDERNELDPALYERLDRDLLARWRKAGYQSTSLIENMKEIFVELERDASERAAGAREGLLVEVLKSS